MEIQKHNKACELREGIRRFSIIISRLERKEKDVGIQIIGLEADYPITKEMKSVLYGMCIAEKAKLEKEFDEL